MGSRSDVAVARELKPRRWHQRLGQGGKASNANLPAEAVNRNLAVRPLNVTLVFQSKSQRFVRVGLAVPLFSKVTKFREMVAEEGKISPDQVILTELSPSGFQGSFLDDEDLTAISEGDNIYAFQAPLSCNPASSSHLSAEKFYALPEGAMEDLKVPLVDTLVVALHSGVVPPKDSGNALKDSMDRKNETALKEAHEANVTGHMSISGPAKFHQGHSDLGLQNPESNPLEIKRLLLEMKRVVEFASDTL
ncbi:UNVERIFIED_CONTAM: hypothetical protein K2H54_003850 [Gekko kuhli]